MDGQQLDKLLKSKINRARTHNIALYLSLALLCLLLLAGLGLGIFRLATRQSPEPKNEPSQNSGATDIQEPEPSKTNTAPDTPGTTQTDDNEPPEEQAYTHRLQMVWFEEPLDALPQKLEITVTHDDETVVSFTLTANDGWQHTWIDQYPADSLTLQGNFPKDVFAVFSVSGENFTVTGVYSAPSTQGGEDTPDASNQPAGSDKEAAENPSEAPQDGEVATEEGQEELPRTGLLRWPAWWMLVAGTTLLMIGLFRKKAHSD